MLKALGFFVKTLGVLWACVYLFAYLDVIDLHVCIGKPGACNPAPPAIAAKVTT